MPEYRQTLGPEVAEVATLAGFAPDPEQQLALDMAFALRPDGKAVVRDFGICAPRQNLKTGFLKQAALGWLYITEQRLIVWSAHEFSTAQEAFRDMCELIEGAPDLDAEVKQIHRGNGEEAIELFGNRRLKFKARTKSGGRGLTGNKIVLDEAMYLRATHVGALRPTLRAVKDPQVVLAGSAGMADSDIWRDYRDQGRAGGDPRSAWLEYGDPEPGGCAQDSCDHSFGVEGCALDDRARWWATNTALGRRISEDTLEADRRKLPAAEFARETLGWWEDPPAGGGAIALDAWVALADPSAERGTSPCFGLATAPDRSWAAIAVAWMRPDGLPQVMLVEYRPTTTWVSERVQELQARWGGAVLADTASRGLVDANEPSQAEQAKAHNALSDAVIAGGLRHGNEAALTTSLRAARWRPLGDTRVLDRKGSADISPLIAAALAVHGLSTSTSTGGWVVAV